jgi:Immunity protein Imm1
VATTAPVDLLTEGGADVRSLPDHVDLIGLLRTANVENPKQSWTFYLDPADRRAPSLTAGLNGDRGTLSWWDGRTVVRPTLATATGRYVDYWNGGHHSQVDAGEEIPAEYVFAAVAEFVATHRRPICIQWRGEAKAA